MRRSPKVSKKIKLKNRCYEVIPSAICGHFSTDPINICVCGLPLAYKMRKSVDLYRKPFYYYLIEKVSPFNRWLIQEFAAIHI